MKSHGNTLMALNLKSENKNGMLSLFRKEHPMNRRLVFKEAASKIAVVASSFIAAIPMIGIIVVAAYFVAKQP